MAIKTASVDANFEHGCSTTSTKGTAPFRVDNECNWLHSCHRMKMHCTCKGAAEGELLSQGASIGTMVAIERDCSSVRLSLDHPSPPRPTLNLMVSKQRIG